MQNHMACYAVKAIEASRREFLAAEEADLQALCLCSALVTSDSQKDVQPLGFKGSLRGQI